MSLANYPSKRNGSFFSTDFLPQTVNRKSFLKLLLGLACYSFCTVAWAGIVPGISSATTSGTTSTYTSFRFTTSNLSGAKLNSIKLFGGSNSTNSNVYLTGGNIAEGDNRFGSFSYNKDTDSGRYLTFTSGTLADFALAANQTYTFSIDTNSVSFTTGLAPVVDTPLQPYFVSTSNWTSGGVAFSIGVDSNSIATVPEPSTLLLFGLTVLALGICVYVGRRHTVKSMQPISCQ
jgi:hypothetical protein